MIDDMTALVVFFAVMLVAGFLIDRIPDQARAWGEETASQADVDKIFSGKTRSQPRVLLKLMLALGAAVVVAALLLPS